MNNVTKNYFGKYRRGTYFIDDNSDYCCDKFASLTKNYDSIDVAETDGTPHYKIDIVTEAYRDDDNIDDVNAEYHRIDFCPFCGARLILNVVVIDHTSELNKLEAEIQELKTIRDAFDAYPQVVIDKLRQLKDSRNNILYRSK